MNNIEMCVSKKRGRKNVSNECLMKKSALLKWKHKFLVRCYCFQFWNQYKGEINKSSVLQITKFFYVKELFVLSVQLLVENLPFARERYQRAKSILKTKYGKKCEIANAHIQQIMSMPIISSSSLSRIHEFFKKVVIHIQTLETMGKMTEWRMRWHRLSVIRSDPVCKSHR